MIYIDVEHRRLSWILGKHHVKTEMITHVLPTTRTVLAGTSDISNLYCFNTALHQRILQGGEPQTNLLCYFHFPVMLHPFFHERISPFNDASSHLLRNCTKFPNYCILYHTSPRLGSPSVIPLFRGPKTNSARTA
jgi:hypothetical protein